MRQPLVPVFIVPMLVSLPAAFLQGVRTSGGDGGSPVTAEAGRRDLNS